MKEAAALVSGLAGAGALTLAHETLRRLNPEAPRMDLIGMHALSKLLRKMDKPVPGRSKLFNLTMAGDLVGNALYYSITGAGSRRKAWIKGAWLGLSAGLGAVLLPKHLQLPNAPSNRTNETKVLTVAIYLLGGLVAAATYNALTNKSR